MGQAAVELFLRVNHARQTLDFAKRQVGKQAQAAITWISRALMDKIVHVCHCEKGFGE